MAGAAGILRSSTASPFYVVVATSVGVSFVFLLMDLHSPLQIRYLLQLLPLLAIFAGKCLSDIMGLGRLGKFAGLLTLGYVMVAGADNMLFCLLERYY